MTVIERLNAPRDAAGLAALRIGFGALMLIATLRTVHRGWIEELYLKPVFHFHHLGFEWVRPWPAWGMYVHVALMGLAAFGLMLGAFTRLCALLFFATFSYLELCDKATYLNHYYLVSLLALLLAFLPCASVLSVDARFRGRRSEHVGRYAYDCLRLQLLLVYFFAGFAKIGEDWLLRGEPLATWLKVYADVPLLGGVLSQPFTAIALSWAGALYDLSIGPLLWWRRTTKLAYALAVVFHLSVWLLFPIGIFSFVMLIASTCFLDPSWPRRLLVSRSEDVPPGVPSSSLGLAGAVVLAAYFTLQVALPLRFLAYPGAVNWTEQGFRFAWRVMLIEKTGSVEYQVVSTDESGRSRRETISPRRELTRLQYRMMSTQPDMIAEYAQHLAERFRRAGARSVHVYARAFASLNGRPSQALIDPAVDLAGERRSLSAMPFIVPLAE